MFILLLTLIFTRPFIASVAFTYSNAVHSLLLAALLTAWFITRQPPWQKIKTIKYPLLLFIAALALSVFFSQDKINSLKALYQYAIAIALFILVSSLGKEEKIYLVYTIIISAFTISLWAIYQYFFGLQRTLEYINKAQIDNPLFFDYLSRRRVFSPFINPNILGEYLGITLILVIGIRNKLWIILPILSAIILTKSLGGLLSTLVACVLYFYLTGSLTGKKIILLLGLLLTILIIFIVRWRQGIQHTHLTFSWGMRLSYWRDALDLIKHRPLTGMGLGNFNIVPSRYAHNSYLQLWAETGVFGLISFLWLVTAVFTPALKALRWLKEKKLYACLIASCSVFLLHNLMDFSFFLPEVAFIWWIVLGMLWTAPLDDR